MRWIETRSGAFPKRLHFDSLGELDDECERLVTYAHYKKFGSDFVSPLSDDALEVLVGDAAEIDLFAELGSREDGVTSFRPGERPNIKISSVLMLDPSRRKRARTTIAHEWFHAIYHRDAWEIRWAQERALERPLSTAGACLQATILEAAEDDWMEFQAGYASCAILMPKSLVQKESERFLAEPCVRGTRSRGTIRDHT
jgi:hypothetical protein